MLNKPSRDKTNISKLHFSEFRRISFTINMKWYSKFEENKINKSDIYFI